MRDMTPWSSGSTMPCYLPDPQPVSRALFRSPLHQDALARGQEGYSSFSISQSEDRLPLLGFKLDQSETEAPFEEELFSGFGGEGSHHSGKVSKNTNHILLFLLTFHSVSASHFLSSQSEINLIEETPATVSTSQSPRDPQRADCKDKTVTPVPSCKNGSSACLECSPSYSPTDCDCSSDSESDAASCQLCLLARHSQTSEDVNTLNKSSQWTPQVPRPSRPPTPYKQPPGKSSDEQPVDRMSVSGEGGALQPEGDREQTASHQDAGPPPQSEPLRPPDTRDSATQTRDVTKRQTSDASTQWEACVPVTGCVGAPVGRAVPPHATGGQTRSSQDGDAAAAAAAPGAVLLAGSQRGDDGPWRRGSREEGRGHYISERGPKLRGGGGRGGEAGGREFGGGGGGEREAGEGREAGVGGEGAAGGVGREAGGGAGGGGGGGRPACVVGTPPVKEVTGGKVLERSEEVETLQEIADILLMLRQRKREG